MLLAADFEPLAKAIVWLIAQPILLNVAAFLPLIVLVGVLFRQRRHYHATADDPFTELPLRPAGESLRLKLEDLGDDYDVQIMMLMLLGVLLLVWFIMLPHRYAVLTPAVAVVLVGYVYLGRKLLRTARRIWDYRLGYTGERVVGEELNQLLAEGFRVFHDVPFDGFNIDHVIVGAPGVYAVETKTRRKPANIQGLERATVVFDGTTLQFPQGWTKQPLEQARRNAKTLAEWLTRATGEPVTASPVVTLPGWFVERRARSDVNVLNPSEVKYSFPSRVTLSPEQIQRVAHQLTERCRMEKRKT